MRVKITVRTNKMGSDSSDVIEVDESDLQDLSPERREEVIEEVVLDKVHEMIEVSWEELKK